MIAPGAHALSREPGRTALPMPRGDPDLVRRAAQRITGLADTAYRTATVRGDLAPLLAEVWTGMAAQQAVAEAAVLGRRSRQVVAGLPSAGQALSRYAAALEDARSTTRLLQRRWDTAGEDYDRSRCHLRTLEATSGIDQSAALASLAEGLRGEQRRLAERHTRCREALRAAAREAQHTLLALSAATFPDHVATAASVRSSVTGDLAFAVCAQRSEAGRREGLDAALSWRQVTAAHPAPEQIDVLVHQLTAVAADPLAAQAFLDEVGIAEVGRVLAVASRPTGPSSLDTVRALAGALGGVIVSATAPTAGDADPRTARQLASGATVLQDEVVRSVASVTTWGNGQHDSGYWLLAQLLVGARESGCGTALPAGFARRLVAATAAAEVARSRDPRFVGRHGTTRSADGGRAFASLFDEGERTGDALHVLLTEASAVVRDDRDVVALLSAPLESPLRNARGDEAVVAEYLVRRWVTHTVTTPQAPTDLDLVTNADLGRLMSGLGASEGAAALRSRVMIEIGRTNELAQREWATLLQYQANSAALESAAVGWVGQMRESVAITLHALDLDRPPTGAAADGYAVRVEDTTQPLLATAELARLVGAFALGTEHTGRGKDPDAAYEQLIADEVQHVADEVRAGLDPRDSLLRLGFYHGSSSAALLDVAERQDRLNEEMWQNVATVKNLAVGPDRLGDAVALVTQGSNRSALDDLVITAVRSDVGVEQAEANERRFASLLATVAPLLRAASGGAAPLTALARGAALAPPTASAATLRQARSDQARAALQALLDERVERRLESAHDRLRDRVAGDQDLWREIAEGWNGPLEEFQRLPRGDKPQVRMVETEEEVLSFFDLVTKDARHLPARGGTEMIWMERSDGILVGLRLTSSSGGATVDLEFPKGERRKVHARRLE